jgi:hypothetical protein
VTQQRGRPIRTDRVPVLFATVHPSAVLRAPPDAREAAQRECFADLRNVGQFLGRDREVTRTVTPSADSPPARGRRAAAGQPRASAERRPRSER